MRTLSLIGFALALPGLVASGGSARELQITASGELPLNLSLPLPRSSASPIPLTIVHRLINLGTRFVSSVGLAELESRLIWEGGDRYLWISPSGRVYRSAREKIIHDGARRWAITTQRDEIWVSSDRTRCVYREGYLREICTDHATIDFQVEGGAVTAVQSRDRSLAIKRWKDEAVLEAGNVTFKLKFNDLGSLLECRVDPARDSNCYRFTYRNDLLSGIRDGGDTIAVEFGACDWQGDFARNRVYHPVVLSLGNARIEIHRDLFGLRGKIIRDGAPVLSWAKAGTEDNIRILESRHTAEVLLSDVDAYVLD